MSQSIHFGLLYDNDSSNMTEVTSNSSRKRPAVDSVHREIPSVSRRRRMAAVGASNFVQQPFHGCCMNGIIPQAVPNCSLQSAPRTYDATTSSLGSANGVVQPLHNGVLTELMPVNGHGRIVALPDSSDINTMVPLTLHVSPSLLPAYTYGSQLQQQQNFGYISTPVDLNSTLRLDDAILTPALLSSSSSSLPTASPSNNVPLVGVRLPTMPVIYSPQPIHDNLHHITMPMQFMVDDARSRMVESEQWERSEQRPLGPCPPSIATTTIPTHSSPTDVGRDARIESLLTRVRHVAAQAAAQAAANVSAHLILAHHVHEQYHDQSRIVDEAVQQQQQPQTLAQNMGDGPVAVPTSLTEWPQILTTAATMHPAATSASTTIADNTIVQSSYVPFDHGRIVNGFNNHVWELAVLQFFDRVAPQMTYMRLQPKGMPKNEIDQLKSYRLSDPSLLTEKLCVICQCDFEKKEQIRVLPCDHHYHVKCVDKWLRTNRTCPICRQSAASDNSDNSSTATATATATLTGSSSLSHIAVQVITQVDGGDQPNNHF